MLTRSDIGIIELNRMSILIASIGTYFQDGPRSITSMAVIMNNTENRILERVLISQSKIPTFVFGVDVPIEIRVSLPVKMTRPMTHPFARTVLVQRVFYRDSRYFLPLASN